MTLLKPELLPTQTYPFSRLRRVWDAAGLQPGVYDAGDLKVTQRAAGANMSVDVAAGRAWIRGLDSLSTQGSYHCESNAVENKAVAAAHATLPRVDQVIARVYDTSIIGGGTDAWQIEVIAGTPTSGAQITNPAGANYRAGAVNLATIAAPKTLIRIGDLLVPAASSSVTNANIVDRRPWARGAFLRILSTAGDISVSAGGAELDTTVLKPRIECSGVPVRLTMLANMQASNAGFAATFQPWIDGSQAEGLVAQHLFAVASVDNWLNFQWMLNPAAGSHQFSIRGAVSGSNSLKRNAASPLVMLIEEIARQNTSN